MREGSPQPGTPLAPHWGPSSPLGRSHGAPAPGWGWKRRAPTCSPSHPGGCRGHAGGRGSHPSAGCPGRTPQSGPGRGEGAGAARPSPRAASFYSDAAPRPPPAANLCPSRRRPATRKARPARLRPAGRPAAQVRPGCRQAPRAERSGEGERSGAVAAAGGRPPGSAAEGSGAGGCRLRGTGDRLREPGVAHLWGAGVSGGEPGGGRGKARPAQPRCPPGAGRRSPAGTAEGARPLPGPCPRSARSAGPPVRPRAAGEPRSEPRFVPKAGAAASVSPGARGLRGRPNHRWPRCVCEGHRGDRRPSGGAGGRPRDRCNSPRTSQHGVQHLPGCSPAAVSWGGGSSGNQGWDRVLCVELLAALGWERRSRCYRAACTGCVAFGCPLVLGQAPGDFSVIMVHVNLAPATD